jgi:hypothetical protein
MVPGAGFPPVLDPNEYDFQIVGFSVHPKGGRLRRVSCLIILDKEHTAVAAEHSV